LQLLSGEISSHCRTFGEANNSHFELPCTSG
jgi:hypothetical protein